MTRIPLIDFKQIIQKLIITNGLAWFRHFFEEKKLLSTDTTCITYLLFMIHLDMVKMD